MLTYKFVVKSDWQAVSGKGTAPSARHSHSGVATKDTAVFFGGTDGSQYFNDVHSYHFGTATWAQPSTSGSGPSPRAGHAAALVGNKMYVFGGHAGGAPLADAWVLDLDSWAWSEVQGPPPARVGACACAAGPKVSVIPNNNSIYLI